MNTRLYNTPHKYLDIKKTIQAIACILIFLFSSTVMAFQSTKLKDVIKSNGVGTIDLFTPFNNNTTLDAATLEQFRLDNNGELVFAIDVNEAANGTEKASTQGVAIESAVLVFIIDSVEYRYDQYTTRTHTMLATSGETQRNLYSTLLGNTGSSRITPNSDSELYGTSFDSTLNFTLPQDISQATSATLIIHFLETNVSLGDPEAFYDFSNGYEDVAIITNEDANFLNELAAGVQDAPFVLPEDTVATSNGGTVYYPSRTGYYIAAYEDYFPYAGDYDFNDLVVAYRVATGLDIDGNVESISGEGYLVARGAGYNHDWHLRIAMPASSSGEAVTNLFMPGMIEAATGYPATSNVSGDIDLKLFPDTRQLWIDTAYEGVNTLDEQSFRQGHRFTFTVTLDAPISLTDLDTAPFDPYLYVQDTRYEIHLKGKQAAHPNSRNIEQGHTTFTDNRNYPYAQVFPETWQVPIERVDLGEAYPEFIEFITSGNTRNIKWFNNPNRARVKAITPDHWKW